MSLNPGITVALKILAISYSEWNYSMVSLKYNQLLTVLSTHKIQIDLEAKPANPVLGGPTSL